MTASPHHIDHHGHDHGHDHGQRHGGHHHAPATFGRAFAVGICLNLAYVVTEVGWGLASHSLALIADAGHNLGDVLSLGAAWLAAWLTRKAPSERYTYGLRGSTILAALSNAVLLLVVTGGVAWAAILRLLHPEPVAGATMMAVAAAGVAVNAVTAILFFSGRKDDLNIRGAFLHMASDALVAVGVVLAGAVVLVTHMSWLDPAMSLVIGAIIVIGTWSLMRESLDLALQAVPIKVDRTAIINYLSNLPGVSEVHDLHIWGMSTTETALTAHLVRPGANVDDALLHHVCIELKTRFAVHHATLQIESGGIAPCALAPSEVV